MKPNEYPVGRVFHTKSSGHGRILEIVSEDMRYVMTHRWGVGSTVSVEILRRRDFGPYRDICTWCRRP